ncbi:MAG TPA: crossover junction endodeoxyribonuclease RuvC [Actinomycetota bacterium]|jgi:crossover junction endodeoxyribonuclease RuvC|nr:crossover junction endodeoxyribonuclease RuvC [Actinomycetota bacterium]
MFDRVVIGIDPGVAATGLAVVAGGPGGAAGVVSAGTIRTRPDVSEPERLRLVHRAVSEAITQHRPEAVAVERLLWGRNVGSAMGVARATGVVLLAASEAGVEVFEYAPLEVKLAVTGNGAAGKREVRTALERIHGVADLPKEADAADAVAVAVCHLGQSRALRTAAR